MAGRDVFIINLIAKDGETVQLDDQLPGPNWFILTGAFDVRSDIRLSWESEFGVTYRSSGIYCVKVGESFIGSRVIVDAPVDNAVGSDGKDFIQGNENANIIHGDGELDLDGDEDTLWGLAGKDTIYGGRGSDDISGEDGDDALFGGEGRDVITGNAGVDTLVGEPGADLLFGGADAGDTVDYSASPAGVRVIVAFGSTTTC